MGGAARPPAATPAPVSLAPGPVWVANAAMRAPQILHSNRRPLRQSHLEMYVCRHACPCEARATHAAPRSQDWSSALYKALEHAQHTLQSKIEELHVQRSRLGAHDELIETTK